MNKSKTPASRRTDIQHIFQCYARGHKHLPAHFLLQFLCKEQMETTANHETVENMIDRYEIDKRAKVKRVMTFEGFFRYMESKDCCVFDQKHTSVYQDMSHPLSHYLISSSHNTYLTADQLVGRSHLQAYVSALRQGCRCLEIDCWDGPDSEPIVYHGYTLTSKILFKDVIATVRQHAFEVSSYPIILSLENHCSREQQVVMAQYLTSILGDFLLKESLNLTSHRELPSPNDLQYKILIKNKKLSSLGESQEKKDKEEEEDEDEDDGEEEQEKREEVSKKKRLLTKGKRKKKTVVAAELSDLVVYTKSVKFVSFSVSRDSQQFYENTSLGEKKARKLVKTSGVEFVQHNMSFITRIYPAGSRTLSSNYNPQEFWNVGAQLVALNFQSVGLPMDLNNGRFQDNGGCGYILKPDFLRSGEKGFDPNAFKHSMKPVHLLLKVISGSNLPDPKMGKSLDPLVRVEIHGAMSDSCRRQTDAVKDNSLNPRWGSAINFTIDVPELALVRFSVRHQTGPLTSDLVGQYTLPFSSMKRGYRWVPLLSREGHSLDPASLFIYVWYC
ncbi:1-phosphatidylinositol 4,5-bisphosphate phosphodiesterase zeta-1-like [Chanos chanos]|uniref:Phosphoinositide phospholipase C n=1 Tax=Chanos chanos TaxID=29144 RepID=A0A6J2W7C1_CHACN|nr:1-phosphatidylinositol 4,5-bisphosphate phosphodiesterase zeta-1-like [Chanos chanos]